MPSRRASAAVLLSLALHAVVAVWLATRPKAPRTRADHAPIELDWVEVAKPETPPPPPEPKVDAQPTPRRRAPKVVDPLAQAPVEPPTPPTDQPRIHDVPASLPTPTLLPSAGLLLTLDAGVQVEEPVAGLRAPEVPQDLVGELARRTIGRGKIDRGLVHPYYADLGKTLLRVWDADRAVKAHGLKGWAEQFGQNFVLGNRIWQSKAENFGKTGTPFDTSTEPQRRPVSDAVGTALADKRALGREMAAQFKASRRAVVRVVQRADGSLAKVELVSPSSDPQVDREALVDVRAAAEKLPAPPEAALNGKEGLSSLWELELIVSISPPVPTLTFEFDEALGFIDARLPLDRRIYKRIHLIEVE